MRYVFQETILRGISPSTLGWIRSLLSYSQRMEPQWISTLTMQHSPYGISTAFRLTTCVVVYSFQTIAFNKIRMISTSPYQRVRIDPEVTVLQLPPPPPEEADVLPVGETCMGLVLSRDCTPLSHEGTQTPVWEHTGTAHSR